jgi:methylmalonyl-CoA mutase N-terminal domain/subunit
VDDFAPRLSFFFNAHNDFFEEIAKYRAAAACGRRIMRERFGAKNPRSWMLRFHTQTAGCSLTAQQPSNNVVRVTVQALAAVLGGTQSLHTNAWTRRWRCPPSARCTIALRTQQILAEETGVANTVDPLGGSLLRRGAHRPRGARGLRLHRAHRPHGRHRGAPSRRLPPEGDRRRLLPLPADVDAATKTVVG